MLMILTDGQILPTDQICQGCLMADQRGTPRVRQGKLCCAHLIQGSPVKAATTYECQMGFRLADIGN
ncbi:hypothetical protein NIES970_04640 [[Synechococcus] sp. NIES-970]|uniref:hypothetical protein n=1 Tax=Picosynechococcus sp. NKBG15041c TaxID=1407650 RepID=UPI00041DC2E8|nr:hypothetical protein [Picosynechococcus sp. NKBG15041c]BAW95555.1 hypothetical protein NIES970_04640 [[Synechococcus] sp. NIES-970]